MTKPPAADRARRRPPAIDPDAALGANPVVTGGVLYVTIGEHQVVAIGRTSGIGLGSGQHFDAEIVHLWTVRNGKLLSFDAFVEDAPITAAINGTAMA